MALLPSTEHVEDRQPIEPFPPGVYVGEIETTEIGNTKSGDEMLSYTFVVTEGDYTGRKVFGTIMLSHEKEIVERIGLQTLKQLKVAVGKPELEEDHELWEVPIMAKVKIERDKTGEYDDKNRITAFFPIEGGPQTQRTATKTPRPAPAASRPGPAPARSNPAAKAAPAATDKKEPVWRSGRQGSLKTPPDATPPKVAGEAVPFDDDEIPF